jgi:hypothetical protein
MIDEHYLAFVRTKDCCRCGAPPPSDPHHLVSRKWREVDRDDALCVPVCRRCHTLVDHVTVAVWMSPWKRPETGLAEEVAKLLVEYFTGGTNLECGI